MRRRRERIRRRRGSPTAPSTDTGADEPTGSTGGGATGANGATVTLSGEASGELPLVRCTQPVSGHASHAFSGAIDGRMYDLKIDGPVGVEIDISRTSDDTEIQVTLADFTDMGAVLRWGCSLGEFGIGTYELDPSGTAGRIEVVLALAAGVEGSGVSVAGSWACP